MKPRSKVEKRIFNWKVNIMSEGYKVYRETASELFPIKSSLKIYKRLNGKTRKILQNLIFLVRTGFTVESFGIHSLSLPDI